METLQDRLDALCKDAGVQPSAVERTRDAVSNEVTFFITLPDGDKIAGKGPTTEAAIAALETKLHGWQK